MSGPTAAAISALHGDISSTAEVIEVRVVDSHGVGHRSPT